MIAGPLVHRISHTNSPAPASSISLFFNAKIGKIHSPNAWRSHPWWLHCHGTQVLVDGSEPFVAVLTLTGECGVHGIETSPNLLALRNHFLLHVEEHLHHLWVAHSHIVGTTTAALMRALHLMVLLLWLLLLLLLLLWLLLLLLLLAMLVDDALVIHLSDNQFILDDWIHTSRKLPNLSMLQSNAIVLMQVKTTHHVFRQGSPKQWLR